jgi:hypothetical protein
MSTVTIASRFCGPPGSANGGYVSGLLAAEIEGAAEVTLRAPPPLETLLALDRREDGRVVLTHGDTLLAEARPQSLSLALPAPVSVTDARDASTRYPGVTFDQCFVCGSARAQTGGLMILPGTVAGRTLVAAPWTPAPDLVDRSGVVDAKYVWSALDCPAWFAHAAFTPISELIVALLGRITGHIERQPKVGETYVCVGWPIKKEGRRIYAGSALFDADGAALAWASTVWVELK